MKLAKIGSFLKRSKIPVDILDNTHYKRVTIRINHNGVSLRDTEIGKKIGTKKQFVLKAGQFIVSKIDARYGAFGIAPDIVDGAIITGNFWAYDVDFSQLNIDWFNQYTNSTSFYEVCERASAGITHRKYLNENFFLNYEIQLPSIEEQKFQIERIKLLKTSFGIITKELSHQLSLVKQLRQAFLSEAMQGTLCQSDVVSDQETGQKLLERIKAEKTQLVKDKKLRKEKELPPIKPEEIPFEIPENWVWCRLGEICSKVGSGSTPKGGNYTQIGIPFFRSQNVHDGRIDFQDIKFISDDVHCQMRGTTVLPGDILLNITGGSLGRCALIPDDFEEGNVSQHVCIIRSVLINKYFIHNLLSSPYIQKLIFSSTTGAGREGLPKYNLEQFLVPIPPLSQQDQIIYKLKHLTKICDDLETSIKQSQLQSEQLLQQVLKEALEVEEELV